MPAFLFFGENNYLLRAEIRELVEKFKKNEGDLNLMILDAQETEEGEIISAGETPPFLGKARLVVVRDFDFKKSADALTKFIESLPEYCTLVFTAKKPDARTKLFKAFKKFGKTKEFPLPKPAEFKKWLTDEIAKQSLGFEPAAVELLATFTLGDCGAAVNEIAKLKTFADGQKITRADVELLTHPNLHTSVFRLTDAIGERRIGNALADLQDIVNRGENLIQIFFMIARQFRILLSLHALANRNLSPFEIARELKLHPFVVQNSLRQVRNFSEAELLAAHSQLLKIDVGLKTGKLNYSSSNPVEFALALEKFIVSFG
ncbi:MAG: DNA polymerase III subunit delta [Patescibacteria group bacterium]